MELGYVPSNIVILSTTYLGIHSGPLICTHQRRAVRLPYAVKGSLDCGAVIEEAAGEIFGRVRLLGFSSILPIQESLSPTHRAWPNQSPYRCVQLPVWTSHGLGFHDGWFWLRQGHCSAILSTTRLKNEAAVPLRIMMFLVTPWTVRLRWTSPVEGSTSMSER